MARRNDGSDSRKQNWFARHKFLTVLLGLVLIIIIASAAGGSKSSTTSKSGTSGNSNTTAKQYRFADRADKQPKDIEVLPNETATLDGVQMVASDISYATQLGEFETADSGKTYVVATVTLTNTSDSTKQYNEVDFRVQTAGGQVLDSTFASVDGLLNSGDLVAGGKVSGKVVFEVPIEDGHQYLIWKPDSLASDRAIVQIH